MKNTEIIINSGQAIDIVSILKADYVAGKLAIIYDELDNPCADAMARELEKSGYNVKRIVYPKGLIVNSASLSDILALDEEVRFVLGVGGKEISDLLKLCERSYILVLTRLDSLFYLNNYAMLDGSVNYLEGLSPKQVVLAKWQIAESASSQLASAYGEILSIYAELMDMKFQQFYSRVGEVPLIEKLEDCLNEFMSKPLKRNSSESIDRLIDCNIKLAKIIKYIDINNFNLEKIARLATMDTTNDYDKGELKAIWMLYYIEKIYRLTDIYSANLLAPSDISENIDAVAAILRLPTAEVYKMLPQVSADIVLKRDYVFREYRAELRCYLEEKLSLIYSAITTMRRLYDDAGQELAEKGSLSELIDKFVSLSLYAQGYPLIKHFVLLGAA